MITGSKICERIKAIRQHAALGQQAFADSLGYSTRSVNAWETGAAAPPVAILSTLRQKYDVDPEWIIMGDDTTPQKQFGPAEWDRLDRLMDAVETAYIDLGLGFSAERRRSIARVLYDGGADDTEKTRKQIRGTLNALCSDIYSAKNLVCTGPSAKRSTIPAVGSDTEVL